MAHAAERRRKAKELEEAAPALAVKLHGRSTRGQRISDLQGDDAEGDETFWGQGAWQEAEDDDSEFSSEEDEPDKFDKDFNDSESDEDDDGHEEKALWKNGRAAKRKRPAGGVYKEPKRVIPPKRRTTPTQDSSASPATDDAGAKARAGAAERTSGPIKRSVRASTKNKTEKSFKVREGEAKAREALQKKAAPQQKTLKGQFTQKQLLLEAVQTEQDNMRWILKQQRLEDEAKEDEARPKLHKALASRYLSRRGHIDTIFFPDANNLPDVLSQPPAAEAAAEKAKASSGAATGKGRCADRQCKITGEPSRYKDPLTGYHYANLAAFKEIRKRYGAAARRRARAQQQEEEDRETGTAGTPSGVSAGPNGGRVENGGGASGGASVGTGAGGAGDKATRNGLLKGAGSGQQSGGQTSAKKQGSSRDTEKKSKSSAGKGKGKGKSATKGNASARAESSRSASPPPSGDDGAERDRQEKPKAGVKRPRKQSGGGKGAKPAKPAKRPFFAPANNAAAAASSKPTVTVPQAELTPLTSISGASRGEGAVDGTAASAISASLAGSKVLGRQTDVPHASASAGANPANPSSIATAAQAYAPQTVTKSAISVAPQEESMDPLAPAEQGIDAQKQRQAIAVSDGTAEVVKGWEAIGTTSATQKCVGWQQPVQTATVPGRPPG